MNNSQEIYQKATIFAITTILYNEGFEKSEIESFSEEQINTILQGLKISTEA